MGTKLLADFFTAEPSQSLILSGAAAVSRGAFEAGVGLVVTYPGSPVVETYDVLAAANGPLTDKSHIVINEHVAYHQAMGYAFAGGRSLAIMKHVGLNVASDPVHYSGYTGVKGGMVLLVGSDPGANCSTGEFDCRLLSLHTHLPILEPGDFQEALDMTRSAFELSEDLSLPVMVVIPSKLCYGMGTVITSKPKEPNAELSFAHTPDLTNVGPRAVERHRLLMGKIDKLRTAEKGAIASLPAGKQNVVKAKELVVTSGIYGDYVREALSELDLADEVAVHIPAMTYPLSRTELLTAIKESGCERIVVVEDLEKFIELQIASILAEEGLQLKLQGKDIFPPWGPIQYQQVEDELAQLYGKNKRETSELSEALSAVHREGTFCPGCPHRAFFDTLLDILDDEDVIGGDIGCSSLPPHFSDWLTCMNSGPSISAGLTKALDEAPERQRVISVIGDSTLYHSGLQTVIECVQQQSNQLCFVLDNSWTAMTGHQPTPGTAKDVLGQKNERAVDLVSLLKACGVEPVVKVNPASVPQMRRVILQMLEQKGFSCVVVEKECKLQEKRRPVTDDWKSHYAIIEDRCRRCNRCYSTLTCPAISKNSEGEIVIDPYVCTGCSVCYQICPNSAIVNVRNRSLPNGGEKK